MSDSDTTTTRRSGRRGFLLAGTTALTALMAGCTGGGDGGDGDDTPDRGTVDIDSETASRVDDYLSSTSNYSGDVFDYTGESNPTVDVGASGNGGNYAFGPAALAVSTGTTVTWEWTGRGQQHNVVEQEGGHGYESGRAVKEGNTFEYTFEEPGLSLYVCTPHSSLGMNGAVVVRE
jgi:halocyanin domain